MKIINVVLSGGVGSRLWPLSRKSKPKQYLEIFDGQSLFQKTVLRNLDFCDELLVVGNKDNFQLSQESLAKVGLENYREIIEACPRNTAAAIAFAAFSGKDDDILFVTPSDHLIGNEHSYVACAKRGIALAKEGSVVTFGIKPNRPETGFGYIEFKGENVLSFQEKPNEERATFFQQAGSFLWNSGMFCFTAATFLSELCEYSPEIYKTSFNAFRQQRDGFLPEIESLEIPSISVDYAVMEKSKKIKVVPSGFDWSDMGSFDSIYEYFKSSGHPIDEMGNMVIGTKIHTEFVGMQNTLFINSPDAVLILQKESSQKVKQVFERLEIFRPELVT